MVYESAQLRTDSPKATEAFAEAIGRRLRGGECIELVSDLGGGKTTFVRGLARGFGSAARVSSPTFTISREYRAGERTMYHFDFYRLQEAGIVANELAEVVHDPQAVVVAEWGDVVDSALPRERLQVVIQTTGDDERVLTLAYPPALAYLLTGVVS